VVLIGTERKTMIKNAIKNIGPCARFFFLGQFKDIKIEIMAF